MNWFLELDVVKWFASGRYSSHARRQGARLAAQAKTNTKEKAHDARRTDVATALRGSGGADLRGVPVPAPARRLAGGGNRPGRGRGSLPGHLLRPACEGAG